MGPWRRVLVKAAALDADKAGVSLRWNFVSVDGSVRIEAADRAGCLRLLRYRARPPFALERLRELDPERLVYDNPKPAPGPREVRCGTAPLVPAAPVCPLAANLASAPARKYGDKRAEPPVAAENRRLTRTTEPPNNQASVVEMPIRERQPVVDPNEDAEEKMKTIGKSVVAALAISALVVGLTACQKKEGPAERAGKDIDKAIDKVGQQMERTGEKIQDAASGNRK